MLSLLKAKPKFFGAGPVFPVHDILAAVEFYCVALGFDLDFVMDDPPTHGSVTRCSVGIQFTMAPPGFDPASYPGYAYIFVDAIDQLHAEYSKKSVRIIRGLESHDHGMREFEIIDCNGFRLRFGQYL
jgi:catechol 2,3-dioxygenase-like lactoylglutathione lyase family enzyme